MHVAETGENLVLIVEDEHDNREIMRAVVEDLLGYEALLTANGEQALQAISRRRPSLILLDLMMPIMDGFETVRRLKEDAATASIPVVAVTALSRLTDRQRAIECGVDGYLNKPFDLDLLASMIEQYIVPQRLPAAAIDVVPYSLQFQTDNSAAS